MSALFPCLWCGSTNLETISNGEYYPSFKVRCKECDCMGPSAWQSPRRTEQFARAECQRLWNDRPAPASVYPAVERALAEMRGEA
jgi:hypothetical protein